MRTALVGALLLSSCGSPPPAIDPTTAPDPVQVPEPTSSTAEPGPAIAEVDEPMGSGAHTTESGLSIEQIRGGDGDGAVAEPGRRVRVHYVGTLMDGSRFDSSRERGSPFEFELGKGHVIPGFEEGVTGMHVGDIRRLIIPPELGYGASVHAKIPANSVLVFEIELLEVN